MKKVLLALFAAAVIVLPSNAATWVAADRVSVVGEQIVKKNSLPATIQFKVVNGAPDNSMAHTTNTIQVSATDLTYTGNDNEVAYVVAYELGGVIVDNIGKKRVRNYVKSAIASNLSTDNVISTAMNSDLVARRENTRDAKEADIMGIDLMINAGYNPLAGIVTLTKMPGNNWEITMGIPANHERANYIYDYLTYNYPSKISAGYGCQEYRNYLAYIEPTVNARKENKKKLAKFNKEQAKIKAKRTKQLAKYKSTNGLSSWNVSYELLKSLTESEKK